VSGLSTALQLAAVVVVSSLALGTISTVAGALVRWARRRGFVFPDFGAYFAGHWPYIAFAWPVIITVVFLWALILGARGRLESC
jgi:hypothetical protein